MGISDKTYWCNAALTNPFDLIRTGWTDEDFRTRDQSVATYFDLSLSTNCIFVDLGCGIGYTARLVSSKVGKYIGIDYCNEMLDIARLRNKDYHNVQFILNNGISIPLETMSVDVLVSELMFQHVCEDLILGHSNAWNYIFECLRVLKTDGRMALQLPRISYYKSYGFNDTEIDSFATDRGLTVWPGDSMYYYLLRNVGELTNKK